MSDTIQFVVNSGPSSI